MNKCLSRYIDPLFTTRLSGYKGGYVDIHVDTDRHKKKEHIEAALLFATRGHQIKLLPEIPAANIMARNLFFPELKNIFTNPDVRFNGKLGDFKIPDSNIVLKGNINDAVQKTAKKKVSVCLISLLYKQYSVRDILRGISGALKHPDRNKSIEEVWLLFRDKSILKISRKTIQHPKFFRIIDSF